MHLPCLQYLLPIILFRRQSGRNFHPDLYCRRRTARARDRNRRFCQTSPDLKEGTSQHWTPE